ncbi:UV radiation resistance protein and autophagy-related subunit 14-domain-containing protein [Aspergillus multicolor]|uniref:Atg14 domain-containing protein n=1 Tax=Aspergillus multicolor TaxID=41759 RepID=UPI003CCDE816
MSCDVCSRTPASAFYCPTCARNQLYQLRIGNASALLDCEYLGQQIEAACQFHRPVYGKAEQHWNLQRIHNEQSRSFARIEGTRRHIKSLQSCINDLRQDISQRKIKLAKQRSDSNSAIYQLSDREAGSLSNTRNNIKRTDHIWHSNHIKTAEARIFLCREAASLYGLRQRVRKRETAGGLKETYTIGGVGILDLREPIGATPEHISTSFCHIAHILVLVSNYLSLRLPAEITLPHKTYPLPTIHPAHKGQSSSDLPVSNQPRPRPLSLDKTLPKLAKEDTAAYALFIEGVTLLAWDVAWLCRSQGLSLGSDSWEDVCDIGRNLWQLLVAPPGHLSSARALAERTSQKTAKESPRTTIQRTKSFPVLGHYSHGTAHSFLGASEGTEFVRNWRLPNPIKVVDRLKSTLLGEMASAEWELLDEHEWDEQVQGSFRPVLRESLSGSDAAQDSQTSPSGDINLVSKLDAYDTTIAPRSKGNSGWTKLRNR